MRFVFLLLLGFSALSADEGDLFHKGGFYIDASYGAGRPNGQILDYITDTTSYQLNTFRLAFFSANTEKQQLGLYRVFTYSPPGQESRNGRLGFEYAMFDWLGLGVSFNTYRVKLTGVYLGPLIGFPFDSFGTTCDGWINPGRACSPGISDWAAGTKVDMKVEPINTVDCDVGFHPGHGGWDPYFKMVMGFGSVYKGATIKLGGIAGSRFRAAGPAYVLAEAYANYYSLQFHKSDASEAGSASVTDVGGRLGVGVTF